MNRRGASVLIGAFFCFLALALTAGEHSRVGEAQTSLTQNTEKDFRQDLVSQRGKVRADYLDGEPVPRREGFVGKTSGGKGLPTPKIACSTDVILNSGITYQGNTSTYANNMPSYTGVSWDESGKEVVHEITTFATTDLRVYLEVADPANVDLDVFLLSPCDSTNTMAAGDRAILYPDLPAGTYYVVVDGYQGSEGAYSLTVAAASGVLLVDDDGSGDALQNHPDVRAWYEDALKNLGYAPFIWNVATLGSPDSTTLNNSQAVVWFCGGAYKDGLTITPTDQNNLAGYLDVGGRLFLAGQDILFDVMDGNDGRIPDGNFFNDYLMLTTATNDIGVNGNTQSGAFGDPVADDGNGATGSLGFTLGSTPFNPYPDALTSRFGEYAFFSSPGTDNRASAVRYDDSFSRSVFLAFAPELENNATDMQTLMDQSMTWLLDNNNCFSYNASFNPTGMETSISYTGDANGYPDPGETMTIQVDVTNHDGGAHNVEVYLFTYDPYTTLGTTYRDLGSIGASATVGNTMSLTVDAGCPVGYELRLGFNIYVDGVYCNTLTIGSFVGQADVLLIKDELFFPNTTGQDIYEDVLGGLGYNVATWETELFGSPAYSAFGLDNDNMMNYPFVVWFTGADPILTLQTADETELTTYLDNGGKLILSSQDYLYDLYGASGTPGGGTFADDYLFVGSFTGDTLDRASDSALGPAGTWPTEYLSLLISDGQTFVNQGDSLTVAAGGSELFSWAGLGAVSGTGRWAKGDAWKTAFMGFAFENMSDSSPPNNKTRFMERLLCMMQMTGSDTVPPCGYGGPADVGATVLPDAGGTMLDWPDINLNTLNESTLLSYRIYQSTNPANLSGGLPSGTYLQNTVASSSYTPPDSPAAGVCHYYRMFSEDVFGQPSTD